ncbi:hypothetical protein HanIR_Chr07g0331921 [Helianthus annuus]|nr:hypothetical protein HanIR_Chr07g0331921 [Helianthus annuus]
MGETGVRKKMTDDTMTTTRFTQFPTACVTGDTIPRIIVMILFLKCFDLQPLLLDTYANVPSLRL